MSDPIDGGQIVLDFSDDELGDLSAADLAHRYLWGAKVDELLADETVDDGSSDDVGWTFTDHQGSVRAVARYNSATNTTTRTKEIVYDAFGNATASGTDVTTPLFLYTGRLYDSATQLQNNTNRWYDATTGRWLSTDPIGFAGDPGNLYRYCGNGPVNWIDPTGLASFEIPDEYAPPLEASDVDLVSFSATVTPPPLGVNLTDADIDRYTSDPGWGSNFLHYARHPADMGRPCQIAYWSLLSVSAACLAAAGGIAIFAPAAGAESGAVGVVAGTGEVATTAIEVQAGGAVLEATISEGGL